MNTHRWLFSMGVFLVLAGSVSAQPAPAPPTGVIRVPADKATRVNPDAHLVITFPSAPALGNAGQIRIYDAADDRLVDTLDLSIPAGPA
jgi:pectinesterase